MEVNSRFVRTDFDFSDKLGLDNVLRRVFFCFSFIKNNFVIEASARRRGPNRRRQDHAGGARAVRAQGAGAAPAGGKEVRELLPDDPRAALPGGQGALPEPDFAGAALGVG